MKREKNNFKVGVENNELIFVKGKRIIDTNNEYIYKFKTKKIKEK